MVEVVIEQLRALSVEEQIELSHLEGRIRTGLIAYADAGEAIDTINQKELWKGEYLRFEDYCVGKWGKSRDWGYRMIGASKVAALLTTVNIEPPTAERQVRDLVPLLSQPNKLIAVWDLASELSKSGVPTSDNVKSAVAKILPPKRAVVVEGDTPIVYSDRLPEYTGQPVTVLKVEGDRVKVEANGAQFTVFRTEIIAQPKKSREQVLEDLLREVLMVNVELPSELVARIEGTIGYEKH